MTAALRAHGQQVDADPVPEVPKVEEKTSEQSDKPGESPAAAATSETAIPSEGVETKTPDHQVGKPGEGTGRANFKSKVVKLEEQKLRLADDLEAERLRTAAKDRELQETRAKLAALEPPAKPQEPERPKRPTKEQAGYDEEKHEQMMADYEVKLDGYYLKQNEKVAAAAIEKDRQDRDAKAQKEAEQRYEAEVGSRLAADVKEIADYEELADLVPGEGFDIPAAARAAIYESEHPGRLIHFYMKDVVDGDGSEFAKLTKLPPVSQVRAIARLEHKLDAEYEAAAKPAAPAEPAKPAAPVVAKEPVKPPDEPAKPKREPRTVSAPIEPVGSRAGTSVATLEQATSAMDYIRRRRDGANR